jgi:hypothetical protein
LKEHLLEHKSIASPSQISLGIEAFILEIPGANGQLVELQGWTKSPRMDRPQYVGLILADDGEGALARLQTNVRAQAADIEAELAPAAPVAPSKTPKPKKSKAPKRLRGDYPDAGDIRAGFRLEVQRTNGLMRDLEQAA